jgi:cell division protein FtsQ
VDAAEAAARQRALLSRALVGVIAVTALTATCAGSFYGWRWLTRGEALRIREIRFTGLSQAKADELAALSPLKAGDNLVVADLEGLERALTRHPWVRAAEAKRRMPPALEVHVSERKPAAMLALEAPYLVDREAQIFKRAMPGDGLDLPVVTGLTREDYEKRRDELEPLLRAALALFERYDALGLSKRARISEMHLDVENGHTLYVGDSGIQVRLGTTELHDKLPRLQAALESLEAAGKKAAVLHLDNRAHPSWVTVRLAGVGGEGGGPASGVTPSAVRGTSP